MRIGPKLNVGFVIQKFKIPRFKVPMGCNMFWPWTFQK